MKHLAANKGILSESSKYDRVLVCALRDRE